VNYTVNQDKFDFFSKSVTMVTLLNISKVETMFAIVYKNSPTVVDEVSQKDATACNLGLVSIFDLTNNMELVDGNWSGLETIHVDKYCCG